MFIIEGRRGSTGRGGLAIDDVVIKPCTEIGIRGTHWRQLNSCPVSAAKECVSNAKGLEYLGTSRSSHDGLLCQKWEDNLKFLQYDDYEFLEDNGNNSSVKNYCRNPTGSVSGPWCFVSSKGERRSCAIPLCGQFNGHCPLCTSHRNYSRRL